MPRKQKTKPSSELQPEFKPLNPSRSDSIESGTAQPSDSTGIDTKIAVSGEESVSGRSRQPLIDPESVSKPKVVKPGSRKERDKTSKLAKPVGRAQKKNIFNSTSGLGDTGTTSADSEGTGPSGANTGTANRQPRGETLHEKTKGRESSGSEAENVAHLEVAGSSDWRSGDTAYLSGSETENLATSPTAELGPPTTPSSELEEETRSNTEVNFENAIVDLLANLRSPGAVVGQKENFGRFRGTVDFLILALCRYYIERGCKKNVAEEKVAKATQISSMYLRKIFSKR